jgi:hypothetical protein
VFEDEILAYLPEPIKPFREQLKNFPDGYEKWVYAASLPEKIYQGDVFKTVPFVCIDDNGAATPLDEFPGMVISNTCDVQPKRSDFALIAPVIELDDYKKMSDLTGEALENHISALMENELSQVMYLPDRAGLGPCFVDFGQIWPISLNYLHEGLAQQRILSFSQCGHYLMLIKLAHHLSRAEADDAKRQ